MDALKGEMASPVQAEFHPQAQQMTDQMLSNCNGVLMKQSVNLAEAAASTMGFGCCEMENVYKMYDKDSGKQLFYVKEESECWKRCCCAPRHEANLIFYPGDAKEGPAYFVAEKPGKCCCCKLCIAEIACLDCCRDDIAMTQSGREVGYIKERCCCSEICAPGFDISSGRGGENYGEITGPTCCIGELCTNTFVTNIGGKEGEITKKGVNDLEGAAKELATDADNFIVDFPDGCTQDQKATILAAAILMDYSFFEEDGAFKCDPFRPSCSLTLCSMFCLGATCPCKCKCDCGQDSEE